MALAGGSSIKAVVIPFPDFKYNVFDPKPTAVHHRHVFGNLCCVALAICISP
jgi:hypothetical protein